MQSQQQLVLPVGGVQALSTQHVVGARQAMFDESLVPSPPVVSVDADEIIPPCWVSPEKKKTATATTTSTTSTMMPIVLIGISDPFLLIKKGEAHLIY